MAAAPDIYVRHTQCLTIVTSLVSRLAAKAAGTSPSIVRCIASRVLAFTAPPRATDWGDTSATWARRRMVESQNSSYDEMPHPREYRSMSVVVEFPASRLVVWPTCVRGRLEGNSISKQGGLSRPRSRPPVSLRG
jgi:hypothetical protein